MLEKTTVLATTYNRPLGLRRLLQHLADDAIVGAVEVLDSSNPEITAQNAETCRELSSRLKIIHRTYSESIHPCVKWLRGLEGITTEFILFCADDDFPISSSLVKCEQFLSENPAYAACQGYFVSILRYANGFRLGEDSFNLGRDEATPEERVWNQFQDYAHVTYGLRRTTVWRNSLERINRMIASFSREFTEGYALIEMADAMFCLMEGKIKRLPLLYTIRNGRPTVEDGWKSSFVFGPDFSKHLGIFQHAFSEALSDATGRTFDDCQELFRRAFSLYFSTVLRSTYEPPAVWKGSLSAFKQNLASPEIEEVRKHLFYSEPELPKITSLIEKFSLDIDFVPAGLAPPGVHYDQRVTEPPAQPPKKTVRSRILKEISRGTRKLDRQYQRIRDSFRKTTG